MVKIVDSIMGSGKTTYFINYIKDNPDKKFIYITPYLKEVKRIKDECNNFSEPQVSGKGKLHNFHKLLINDKNIATTHALFKMATYKTKQLIISGDYTLILDEVMDVISEIKLPKEDIETLKNENLAYEKDNYLMWNEEKTEYDGTFTRYKLKHENLIIDMKELCLTKSIMTYNDNILLWNFPVSIFDCFDDVYILTYLFKGQIQKYYFDLHKIKYEFYHIENRKLCKGYKSDYTNLKTQLKDKINIIEGKINNIGINKTALSKSWYIKSDKQLIEAVRKNLINYFQNIVKGKSKENMWTTFKDYKNKIKGNRYTRSFVPLNERATNKYNEKKYLAYSVNRYMHTIILKFFHTHGIEVDQELYALSEMLQWIWRSQIREGKSITIYIPSLRMRTLLKNWLN